MHPQDKSLNSRIRFSLEEVLVLRMNNWQARREQEGPARLDQIHQKAAQEEAMAMMKGQGQGHHGGGPPHQQVGKIQHLRIAVLPYFVIIIVVYYKTYLFY